MPPEPTLTLTLRPDMLFSAATCSEALLRPAFSWRSCGVLQLLEQEIAITHFIAWHHDALEFLADQFFDVGQSALFFAADKRDGDPRLAGAAGATDTVHIVLCQEGRS